MQLDRREKKKSSVLPWGGHYGWQGWVFFMWQCALLRREGFVFMTSANGRALAPLVCISCLVPSIALLLSFPGVTKGWEISYQKDCGSLGWKWEQLLNVTSWYGVKGKDTETFYRFFFYRYFFFFYLFHLWKISKDWLPIIVCSSPVTWYSNAFLYSVLMNTIRCRNEEQKHK